MTASPDIFTTLATSRLCDRPGCGMRFTPYRHYHRWCSPTCKDRDRHRLRHEALERRTCKRCGQQFIVKRHGAVFCSRVCKNKAHNHRVIDPYIEVALIEEMKAEASRLGVTVSRVAQMCVDLALSHAYRIKMIYHESD